MCDYDLLHEVSTPHGKTWLMAVTLLTVNCSIAVRPQASLICAFTVWEENSVACEQLRTCLPFHLYMYFTYYIYFVTDAVIQL